MTEQRPIPDLAAALAAIEADQSVPGRVRRTAGALRTRLSGDVRIGIYGLDPALTAQVMRGLEAEQAAGRLPCARLTCQDAAATRQADFSGTDIALWCSASFSDADLSLWEQSPDALKDHSYLVTPLADGAATPPEAISAAAAEWFLAAIGVPSDGGMHGLTGELDCRIRRGREADQDAALLLIRKHGTEGSAPQPVHLPEAAAPAPAPQSGALAYLDQRATDLASGVDPDDAGAVLTFCAETCEFLADMLAPQADPRMADDLLSAADALVLMSVEGRTGSAVDAVTTLLQLRKELKTRQAA